MNNLTALTSLFARVYHSSYPYHIYNDIYGNKIITKDEYNQISENMTNGINFFNPDFKGTRQQALRYIVDKYLSPIVILRERYNYDILKNEIRLGCKQYLNIASGYDTTGYMVNNKINVFELDKVDMINDKISRIQKSDINNSNVTYVPCDLTANWKKELLNSNYNINLKTHCSLLGITYYLSKEELKHLIKDLSSILCEGSSILFDFPDYDNSNNITELLVTGASEAMKTKYSNNDITNLLNENDFLIFELLEANDLDQKYFYDYNTLNPNHKLYAPANAHICLAIKKQIYK